MESILGVFGIDWHLLLISAINFGLLLAGLLYFLYRPILGVIEERRARVAKGVVDAQKAQEVLSQIELSQGERLAAAGREADAVVAAARALAATKQKELVAVGEERAAQIVEEAEAHAGDIKAKALEESKREVAKLVVLGVERMLKKS